MESIAIIVGLFLAVIWALRELRNEKLKSNQLPKLKKAIVKNEELNKERDQLDLENADGNAVIGFLNRLRENNRNSN